jgi:hypothetical protein
MKGSNITITAGAFSKARRFSEAVPYLDLISQGVERLVAPREVRRFDLLVRSLDQVEVNVRLDRDEFATTPLREMLAKVVVSA